MIGQLEQYPLKIRAKGEEEDIIRSGSLLGAEMQSWPLQPAAAPQLIAAHDGCHMPDLCPSHTCPIPVSYYFRPVSHSVKVAAAQ